MTSTALHYQKHQRDYTLIGTCIVFADFFHDELRHFFSYEPNPMYVLIESGVLYHYPSDEDAKIRAKHCVENYDISQLEEIKQKHDAVLAQYRLFLHAEHADARTALEKLHHYFQALLPLVLVAIEVPEHEPTVVQEMIDFCMLVRKENEDVYKLGLDMQKALLENIEQQQSLPKGTLAYLTAGELHDYLSHKQLPENIEQRKQFILVECTADGERKFFDSSSLHTFGLADDEVVEQNEFSGRIAFPGKAQGKVCIIRFVEDAARLEEGDILVTAMTDPRYVPIMKKAAAIVTDEGGITCHAAIVSRELKKPCVIGTKIATKVLKDGDMVEVDAEKGIVRKIF